VDIAPTDWKALLPLEIHLPDKRIEFRME
jgi:hypothetical protein